MSAHVTGSTEGRLVRNNAIRTMRVRGFCYHEIAEIFGISVPTVTTVCRGIGTPNRPPLNVRVKELEECIKIFEKELVSPSAHTIRSEFWKMAIANAEEQIVHNQIVGLA